MPDSSHYKPLTIDVDYDPERVLINKKRWDKAFDLSVADRPPVAWGIALRYLLPQQQINYLEFFNDPISELTALVKNWKWIAEKLPGDMITELKITLQPQFENVSNSNTFGSPVRWDKVQPPSAMPFIKSMDELEKYTPPPFETTLWQKMMDYYYPMKKYIDDGNLKVTMRGHPIEIDVQLHTGGESPFCVATDLCGTQVYEWLVTAPEAMHRLLNIITGRLIETEKKMRKICGHPEKSKVFFSDDSAQVISLKHFREFAVPYTNRIYDAFTSEKNDRIMHLCGRHLHLYPALLEDMHISGLWGYGTANEPEEVRDGVGGKIWLLGNLDPGLLYDGPQEEIQKETIRLLDALLPCGGIIVGDGYNIIPDTPLENLQTVVDTVSDYCK